MQYAKSIGERFRGKLLRKCIAITISDHWISDHFFPRCRFIGITDTIGSKLAIIDHFIFRFHLLVV